MPFDAKAAGWATVFQQSGKAVVLAEELNPEWWDKNKQLLAAVNA